MSEESQDEMGQQITYKSFKIAYFVLVVVMFLLLIFSEGFSMGANLDGVKTSPVSSQFALPHYLYLHTSTIAFNLFTVRQFLTVAGVCNF